MELPYITAHSGCEGTELDSLASIERGLASGADLVEVDVRMDPAGTLRISHSIEPSESAYAARAALQQVFDMLRPTSAAINLDIKESLCIPSVLALAAENGFDRDRLFLSGSINLGQLYQNPLWGARAHILLNLEEILKYALFTSVRSPSDFQALMGTPWKYIRPRLRPYTEYVPLILRVCQSLPVSGCNCPEWFLSEEVCAALSGRQLPLSVWTVDEEAAQRRFLSDSRLSLLNLTTHNVGCAVRLRCIAARGQ